MGLGVLVLVASVVWSLIIMVRVKVILGQKYFVTSGDHIFNMDGIPLNDQTYIVLWLLAIAGICFGLWLIYSHLQNKGIQADKIGLSDNDKKKCPACAEIIKLEAVRCKHCGENFSEEDVKKLVEERRSSRRQEFQLVQGQTGDCYCCVCKGVSPINGMYYHVPTQRYYHEKCIPNLSVQTEVRENVNTPPVKYPQLHRAPAKFCIQCGSPTTSGSKFCIQCGVSLTV